MSLSTCEKCGGHIPLGPDATNCCEKCGTHVMGRLPDSVAMTCPICHKAMLLEGTGFNSTKTHHRFCLSCAACQATVVMDVLR